MMKFFRKHNKELLVVFMAALMVVFVGGSALTSLLKPQGTNDVLAHSDLGDLTQRDLIQANAMTELLDRLGHSWQQPLGPLGTEPITTAEWVLLSREAAQLGVEPSLASLRNSLEQQPGMMELIENLAYRSRVKPDVILTAIQQLQAVRQTAQFVAVASRMSEAEFRTLARDALEQVEIKAVAIPADVFTPPEEGFSPSEADLQALYAQYREKEPGRGMNFGYYVSDAVRIQYYKIDRQVVEDNLRVGESTLERDARRIYEEGRGNNPAFNRPLDEEPTEQNIDELVSTIDDAVKDDTDKAYLTWTEARDKALGMAKRERANDVTSRIANWLRTHLDEAWVGVQRGDDLYKVAPKNVAELSYYPEQIEVIPRALAYEGAVTVQESDFFNDTNFPSVPDIGRAMIGGEPGVPAQRLKDLAFNVQGLAKIPMRRQPNVEYLSQWETLPRVLHDGDGNLYLFRVIEIKPAHAPESLDEVRERVVNDLRLQRGYDQAILAGESLLEMAQDVGDLAQAFDADADLKAKRNDLMPMSNALQLQTPPPFSRVMEQIAFLGRQPTRSVPGLGMLPLDVIDGFFALRSAEKPFGLFEVKDSSQVIVVQWLSTLPPREDGLARMRDSAARQLNNQRFQEALRQWLDPDKIQSRHAFELAKQ